MTSQISLFKIMNAETKKRKWIPALSTVTQLILGIIVFTLLVGNASSNTYYYIDNPTASKETFIARDIFSLATHYFFVIEGIIAMAGAFICAMFSFDYLFNKNKVDFYHALPVKREKMFTALSINGFLYWLIPAFITHVIAYFICLPHVVKTEFFGMLSKEMSVQFTILILTYLGVYFAFILGVLLSGNYISTLANMGIVSCAITIIYLIWTLVLQEYTETAIANMDKIELFASLSPLPGAIGLFDVGFNGLENKIGYCIIYILITIIMAVISLFLYKNRKSETSEKGAVYKPVQNVFTVIVTVLAAVLIGSLFRELSNGAQDFWSIVGALMGAVLAYSLISIIFNASAKNFLGNKALFITSICVSAVLQLIFITGLFGYDNYIPKKEKLESITILPNTFRDDGANLLLGDDGEVFFNYEGLQISNVDIKVPLDEGYALAERMVQARTEDSEYMVYCTVRFNLKNGRKIYREYYIRDTFIDMVDCVLNAEGYKETFYKISTQNFIKPLGVTVEDNNFDGATLTEKEADELLACYEKDFDSHYSAEELFKEYYDYSDMYRIECYYNEKGWPSVNLPIPENYTETIKYIEENLELTDTADSPYLYKDYPAIAE
ncbi:MAG: DUF6449 domain-containing protein [Acetatifactor sp.]|nr:DUF6449 domain-containing protein [Acetatifactor sp.]